MKNITIIFSVLTLLHFELDFAVFRISYAKTEIHSGEEKQFPNIRTFSPNHFRFVKSNFQKI